MSRQLTDEEIQLAVHNEYTDYTQRGFLARDIKVAKAQQELRELHTLIEVCIESLLKGGVPK